MIYMLQDAQGLAVTTTSPVAIAAINQFTQQALSYHWDAQSTLFQGNVADRECALIHAYTAAYYLAQEDAVYRKQALSYLSAAQRWLNDATERERWTVQAIAAWAKGDTNQAIALHETIVEHYPQDILAIQQAQYHYFYQGKSLHLLRVAEKALKANPDDHYLYGMVAFGLEQCHRFSEAELFAHKAISINRHDPWAHHAIAHVLDSQGRIDEGIAWMESHADTWDQCNSMLYTHNWWHIALYYLAKEAYQTVLNLYDVHVWGRARQSSPKDQVGAIATLIRLELRGVDVGSRWQDLSRYVPSRLHEHCLCFQDLHYIYALTRSGQTDHVTEMLDSMMRHAQRVDSPQHRVWAEVVIPVAHGIIAHAIGYWSEAIAHLQPVLPRLSEVGGSRTQLALFQQLYSDALQKLESQRVTFPVASSSMKSLPLRQTTVSDAASRPLKSLSTSPWTSRAVKSALYQKILEKGGSLG
jgi:tetratricopeptide (TPR) repeat protein